MASRNALRAFGECSRLRGGELSTVKSMTPSDMVVWTLSQQSLYSTDGISIIPIAYSFMIHALQPRNYRLTIHTVRSRHRYKRDPIADLCCTATGITPESMSFIMSTARAEVRLRRTIRDRSLQLQIPSERNKSLSLQPFSTTTGPRRTLKCGIRNITAVNSASCPLFKVSSE